LFLDPVLELFPVESTDHDFSYLSHQMTYFALQALDALGMKALHPLRFMEQFGSEYAIETWLEKLDWSNAWLQSNRVMFVLTFLIYQAETGSVRSSPGLFHRVLDWLDQDQDPETGLWGTSHGASLLNSVAATYHFIPFYEYVHRPVLYTKRIIDSALTLQQADGLFGAEPGGGACEDLDAMYLLAALTRRASYRAEEIKRALIRSHWAVWNLQNEDGGFCYARRHTAETSRYSSWAAMEAELRESDVWSTWFRLLALATVRATYPGDLPPLGEWQFRRWPALGYHRLGEGLSDTERAILPLWIRPVPYTESQFEDAPPAVSVIIPCYNMGPYVHEALKSALVQTLQQIEVIIVNDGSTDEFTRLLLDLLDHPKVQIIHQDNNGLSAARNAGIRQARGRYICCLDADDRLRPPFLERAFAILEEQDDVGFVTSYYQTFDDSHDLFQYNHCNLPEMLVKNQVMVSALFRREAWERIGGYCETLSGLQDWDFWIGILELGYRGMMIPDVLFEYRVRPDSMLATSRQPENYGRLLKQISERHRTAYSRHVTDVMAGMGVEHANLLQLYHRQIEWIKALEQNIASFDEQRTEREEVILELRAWIGELEQGKAWLEEQGRNWQRLAEEREAQLNQIDEFLTRSRLKSLIRLGSRLGVLRQGLAEKTFLD
jgi:glycosyltransferase involved in cell wall biosynthesis